MKVTLLCTTLYSSRIKTHSGVLRFLGSKMNFISDCLRLKPLCCKKGFNSKQLATPSEIESSKMVSGSTTDGSWYQKGSVYASVVYKWCWGVFIPEDYNPVFPDPFGLSQLSDPVSPIFCSRDPFQEEFSTLQNLEFQLVTWCSNLWNVKAGRLPDLSAR